MASPLRKEDLVLKWAEVEASLFAHPYSFDFFQAVRLLQLLEPTSSPVGDFANPRHESVRFGVHVSLDFPASSIFSLLPPAPESPARMDVNFMGLIGPMGLLPNYYTELVADRLRAHDATLTDFLNLFHHRMVSLFYRAWERSHFTIGFEREGTDAMTSCLLDLVGLGLPSLQSRQLVRDESILFYSGLFGLSARSAVALESIISDYFDVPVEIQQFIGVWRALGTEDQCCFESGSWESRQLGLGAVAGDEVWDRQSRAQIRIGPLDATRYRDFLPDGDCFEPLRTIVRFFSGNDVEYEIRLVLQQRHVPGCELGDELGQSQLGWFTWMKSTPSFDRDPSDTVLFFAEN